MRLQVSRNNIVEFLRRTVMSFESWAERKRINLDFHPEPATLEAYFDRDKLEKILNNLMSNALKFTQDGGAITVDLSSPPPPSPGPGEGGRGSEVLRLSISDTGPGIAPEHLPHIFARFYRVDETHTTEGTGIGLALTKELIDLHHGTIAVESTLGKGSVFTVTLPMRESAYRPEEITESFPQGHIFEHVPVVVSPLDAGDIPAPKPQDGKPLVIVVEDNADLRRYIREFLEADYAVHEAENGEVGYGKFS